MRHDLKQRVALLGVAGMLAGSMTWVNAQQPGGGTVAIDSDDIGGVVTSPDGPEAGVWVIAETSDLATKFVRIVVTDDRGRYVLPDLPDATYDVFVRGYGLVDSARVPVTPGQILDLAAVVAPSPQAAAQVYPANYWLALMEVPRGDLSPRTLTTRLKSSAPAGTGCMTCHQLGNKATRELSANLGRFGSSLEAWDHRVRAGPVGSLMSSVFQRLGPQRRMLADWTDRIAAGAVPRDDPPRPAGLERNLVISQGEWGTPTTFTHTPAATDKRNPTVNAGGRVYGPDRAHDSLLWMDPVEHTSGRIDIPTRDLDLPSPSRPLVPSPYWGDELIWEGVGQPRTGAMDQDGRVWFASKIRANENQPAYCGSGSTNPYARYFPLDRGGKQAVVYDPRSDEVTLVDTCFTTDHNDFAENDPDNSIYFGEYIGEPGVVGWISTRVWDATQDEEAAQGWCPGVLDTNGDGTITRGWTEPDEPIDPTRDHRIAFGCYSVASGPDGSAWCTGLAPGPGRIVRVDRGSNPPETCKAEVYTPPRGMQVLDEGGVAVDSQGVVWMNWRATDHVTSFDRRRCAVLSGPTATGAHCPEGWRLYRQAGPTFSGTSINADLNYLIFVDRHDTLGLGRDVPMTYAVNSDAVIAVLPESGDWVTLRVPYPLGFYTRAVHGRIDDPNTDWKGRGLWSSDMTYTAWHKEGGQGSLPKVVKFQIRPDPLAK